jgi:putative membrane protein
MLRLLFRSIFINLIGIYFCSQILSGVIIYFGGYQTLLLAALGISAANLVVKPIVNLLLLPIHLITLGLFRWVTNMVTLYLVTWLIPNLQIHAFVFPGADLRYLVIPQISFSAFGAFIITTLVLTATFHLLYWLLQD